MTTKTNNAQGGSDNVTVVPGSGGNSGGLSGNYWDVISNPGVGDLKFSAAAAVHGGMGYRFTNASGSQSIARFSGFASKLGVVRFYLKSVSPIPGSGEPIMQVCTATDGNIMELYIDQNSKYTIINAVYGGFTTLTNGYQAGDRIEISWNIGTSTSNGAWTMKLFRGDSTTAVETKSSTTENLGTVNWGYVQWGQISASAWTATLDMDDFAVADGTNTMFGPAVANTPPVVDAGADKYAEPFSTVSLSGSASDPDGSIASHSWSLVSTTGPANPTLADPNAYSTSYTSKGTWHAGHTDTWRLTATDNQGAQTSDDIVVSVRPATHGLITNPATGAVQALKRILT